MKLTPANLIILTAFLMPLGVGTQNLSLILLFVAGLVFYKRKKKALIKEPIALILLILYPIIVIISSINDMSFLVENPNVFLALIIPVLLSLDYNLNAQCIHRILFAFIVSISLLSFVKTAAFFLTEGLEELLIHPQKKLANLLIGYSYLNLSMYVGTAILFSVYLIAKCNRYKKSILAINILFLLFFLLLLSSRVILVATLFVSLVMILAYAPKGKRIFVTTIFGVFIFISTLTIYKLDPPIVEKMKEAVNHKNEYSNIKEKWGGRIMREEIWSCAITLIKQKLIFGYGYNNVQEELNFCYENTSKHPVLYRGKSKKNAHNQFLQITLSTGLIGLFLFLSFLFYGFRKAVANKSPLRYLFIIFAAMCFLTESHLERNHTIYLFYFFMTLFFQPLKDDKNTTSS